MTEPQDPIDTRAAGEERARESNQSSYVARAGNTSGMVTHGSEPGPEQPDQVFPGGVADGNPVAGVTIDADDAAEAVSGDTGPANPGERRDFGGGGI